MVARADLEVVLRATDRASPSIRNLESSIIRFVGSISAALAGLAAIAFPVSQAAEFEKELRNVQKTTGFVDAEIKLLSEDLVDLSRGLVASASNLAQIAATAGQLGLGSEGREAIVQFTLSVSRAATALDLVEENAAKAGARILNIFQLDISDLERVFATINELSNTTTASAQQLIDVIARIGPIADLTFQQVSALGATALDLGVSPEVAGTSLVKVFSRIQAQAGDFAEELGISIGDFIALGAEERFRLFLDTISRQSEVVRAENIRTLAGSGRIFALVNKFVNDAANGFEGLNQNVNTANEAFVDGTSAIIEYENVSQGLLARLANLRNNFSALSIEIGLNLIPELVDATEDLAEFLQTDRARRFAEVIGEAFTGAVRSIIDFVTSLKNIDVNFRNIIAVVRVFIGFKVAQIFAGIFANLVLSARGFAQLTRQVITYTATLLPLTAATTAATAAQTAFNTAVFGATARVGLAATLRGLGLLRLGVVGIIALLVGLAAAFLTTIGLESDLLRGIAEFFGFISSESAKEQAKISDAAAQAAKDARKVGTEFRAAAQQQAAGAFDVPANLEFDVGSGIEVFTEQAKSAADAVNILTSSIRAGEQVSENQAAAEARTAEQIEAQIALVEDLTEKSEELNNSVSSRFRGHVSVSAELRSQRTLAEANLLTAELQLGALQRSAAQQIQNNSLTVGALAEQRAALAQNQEALARNFTEGQIRLVRLNAELELQKRQLVDVTELLEEQSEIAARPDATTDQLLGLATTQRVLRETQEAVKETEDQIVESTLEIGATSANVIQPLVDDLTSVATDALPAVADNFEEVEAAAGDTGEATDALRDKIVQLATDFTVLSAQKEAIEELGAASKEAAETAKGIFDNTSRSVRAFRGTILDAKRELETGLEDRVINLRIERRASEFDTRIENAEAVRQQITEDFQERIDNARNNAERIYLERRRQDALDAIEREITDVESERRALEERALRERFDLLRQRTADFLAAARQEAAAGNLDEALGLREAAQQATQDLGGVITELQKLEDVDPFGNRSFRVSEREIQDLIAELTATERSVSTAIPEINKDLRDSTEAAAKAFEAQESIIEERLNDIGSELDKLAKVVPNIRQIVEAIGSAIEGTPEFARVAAEARRVGQIQDFGGTGAAGTEELLNSLGRAAVDARIGLQDFTSASGAASAAIAERGIDTGFGTREEEISAINTRLAELRSQRDLAQIRGQEKVIASIDSQVVALNKSKTALEGVSLTADDLRTQQDETEVSLRELQIRLDAAVAERQALLATGGGDDVFTPSDELRAQELNAIVNGLERAIAIATPDQEAGEGALAAQLLRARLLDPSRTSSDAAVAGENIYASMAAASVATPLKAEVVGTAGAPLPVKVEDVAAGTGGRTANDFRRNFAGGGVVSGTGGPKSDSIAAMVSNGEFIVNAATRKFFGSDFFFRLQALAGSGRKLRVPGFATGGPIGIGSQFEPVVQVAGAGGAPVHIHLPGGDVMRLREGDDTIETIKQQQRREARKRGRRVK